MIKATCFVLVINTKWYNTRHVLFYESRQMIQNKTYFILGIKTKWHNHISKIWTQNKFIFLEFVSVSPEPCVGSTLVWSCPSCNKIDPDVGGRRQRRLVFASTGIWPEKRYQRIQPTTVAGVRVCCETELCKDIPAIIGEIGTVIHSIMNILFWWCLKQTCADTTSTGICVQVARCDWWARKHWQHYEGLRLWRESSFMWLFCEHTTVTWHHTLSMFNIPCTCVWCCMCVCLVFISMAVVQRSRMAPMRIHNLWVNV